MSNQQSRKKVTFDLNKFNKANARYPEMKKTKFAKMIVEKIINGDFDGIDEPKKIQSDINLPKEIVDEYQAKTKELGFKQSKACIDLVLEEIANGNESITVNSEYQRECRKIIAQLNLMDENSEHTELDKMVDPIVELLYKHQENDVTGEERSIFEKMIKMYLDKAFDIATTTLVGGYQVSSKEFQTFKEDAVNDLNGTILNKDVLGNSFHSAIMDYFEPFVFNEDFDGRNERAEDRETEYLDYMKVSDILNGWEQKVIEKAEEGVTGW